MEQHRFRAFLERRQPFGDAVDLPFVDDAVSDHQLPDPSSWEELKRYIMDKNPEAPPDVLAAAKHVWELYQQGR